MMKKELRARTEKTRRQLYAMTSSTFEFVRAAFQLVVVLDMTELCALPNPAEDLPGTVLPEKIDAHIGGRCFHEVYVRKGKAFIEIQTYSLAVTDGAELRYTVQFLCDTFHPLATATAASGGSALMWLKADHLLSTTLSGYALLDCSWPDPKTGEVALRSFVTIPADMPDKEALVGRQLLVRVSQPTAPFLSPHLVCMGVCAPHTPASA